MDIYHSDDNKVDSPAASQSVMALQSDKRDADPIVAQYLPLPLEVIEIVATFVPAKTDLLHFALTCKDFAFALSYERSAVWRNRFLNKYDHPIIEAPNEFRIAYQLREMVLGKFPSFSSGGSAPGRIALEVMRDMVLGMLHRTVLSMNFHESALETYLHSRGVRTACSRNLRFLCSPEETPFLTIFLCSPFPAYTCSRYGPRSALFEVLQLIFSHVVLHPDCKLSNVVATTRGNYDLSIIYLLDKRLELICSRTGLGVGEPIEVNLGALLHIRNFWQSHLTDKWDGLYSDVPLTYQKMSQDLVRRGRAPKQWEGPIQQPLSIASSWTGHYSCIHAVPRKLAAIEEYQTCAQDWIHQFGDGGVHPLTLDIATTPAIESRTGWWPPIFSAIPLIEDATRGAEWDHSALLLRGIAPFLSPSDDPNMYPAYTALRVRGLMQPLADREQIPGWKRIIMILYKPTSRYLLAVLDENAPDDDDPFGQMEGTGATQDPLPSTISNHLASGFGQNQASAQDDAQPAFQPINPPDPQPSIPNSLTITTTDEETSLKIELEARPELKGPLGPVYLTRQSIAVMEDQLHPPDELAWEDIEYAYLYEGVILPGGMVMMGRWWRIGVGDWDGTTAGGDEDGGMEQGGGADRGPWVFWC